MDFAGHLNNILHKKPIKNGQTDQSEYKNYVQIFLINNNNVLTKRNSILAKKNKLLYDIAIQDEVEKDETYLQAVCRVFKECTEQTLKLEDNNQDENRCVYTPRIFVNHKEKEIYYIYFIKYNAVPCKKFVEQRTVDAMEFIDLDNWVKVFFSKKHAFYSDSYNEIVRLALSDVFDIAEGKKETQYHRKSN